ncbi:MAG: DUF928 domain-containing protein [Xenococcaceae cyanobacterium MO_207.B15]|nr:DUF928 domain-containing protein [Xenococcaceae cyanobacterium MO_207.B15]MDJ0746792.1 DUF928 domain-containing protein [Xenococcaceae cyanobacterium MO_167.B27]
MNFPKTILITSLLLVGTLPALASNRWLPGYKVSKNPKKVYQNNSTTLGASRSYCVNPLGDNSLDLVVPSEKVVHLTASSNPSFYFYSEGAATLPLIFTFVDLDVIEPLVEQTIKVNEEGYYKITLPPEIKLKAGKNYVWTIAIPCSNTPENFREVLRASVKYVPPSPELVQKIQNAHSDKEKAQIYAKESMWYDAIKFLNLDDFELKFDSNN